MCKTVAKIVNHWDKRDMYTENEIKSGLESVRIETDAATHKCKLLLRKNPEHWGINIVLF